jgi:hypothetical protein
VNRPRAADDFATIRVRMEELRREREQVEGAEKAMASDPVPVRVNRIGQVAMFEEPRVRLIRYGSLFLSSAAPALASKSLPNSPKMPFHPLSLPRRSVVDLLTDLLRAVSEAPAMFPASSV